MEGTSLSDVCIGSTGSYNLTRSIDGLTLTGNVSGVFEILTRLPLEPCFVGHWTNGNEHYIVHISATAFDVSYSLENITLEGDFAAVVGDHTADFLKECSEKLSPVMCVDAFQ